MTGNLRFSSIRWRIVLIYFILVFIATTIVGVFIMSQLEAYYKNSISENIKNMVYKGSSLISTFGAYDELGPNQEAIQTTLQTWSSGGGLQQDTQQVFVVDRDLNILASNNQFVVMKKAGDLLNLTLIRSGLNGEQEEMDNIIASQNIPVKNMVFPIGEPDNIKGVLYFRQDMSSTYDTIDQSKVIFVKGMVIALVITVVLGFFIARSITVPINDVTEKAKKMAQGDFSQVVSVKSDDEIGRLAEMFNLLRQQLDLNLTEMSNEKGKLETILRYMADGLIAVDLSGHIIHANPAAMAMLAISDEDMEMRRYDDLIRSYNENFLLDKLMENCKDGGAEDILFFRGAAFSVRYDRFKNENAIDIGIIMVLHNITERQKLENMQTEFVANVSHELKTPLTTIKSYTETLREGEVDDPELARNFLAIIDDETDRMTRLVKDLLQLSRLDYQREKWNKKETNLIFLLKSAITKVEMTARNKDQQLNCLFDETESIVVIADKDRIEQVLLNILSNAIKYTLEGGHIDIEAGVEGKQALVTITDSGIGIPEAEMPRIFERFFRVDKARSRAMGGTGLGLSISKQIVEEHQGTISIDSWEGKGTKVTVALPIVSSRGQKNIE